jgi:hypothetical protein
MGRDTLQDDLDLILAPSRDAQLPAEWDWEPPLGTDVTVGSSAEPTEPEETETAGDSEDGAADDEDEEDD